MAVRREDASSKMQDFQIGSSWIPETPAKPGSTNQQLICTNWQENSTVQANWLELERYTPANLVTQANVSESGKRTEFMQRIQCQMTPAHYTSTDLTNVSNMQAGKSTTSNIYEDSLSSFDISQAGEAGNCHIYGESSCTYAKYSVKEAEQLPNMSFGDLLALAHAAGNKAAIENVLTHDNFAASSTSCFGPHSRPDIVATSSTSAPQTEGNQFTMSFWNSSQQYQDGLLGENFVIDGSPIPSKRYFDLNSSPITDATLRNSTSSQFEPITPETTNKAEYRQQFVMKGFSIDIPAGNENEIFSKDGVLELQEKKDKSHGVNNQLCEALSSQLQENHRPDKGGTEEANLSKTPQQKTRRKKHRPKVIIEGQHKTIPKLGAEKPSVPQESTRVKRNYVRRKVVDSPSPSQGETIGADLDNKTPSSMETPAGKRYRRKGVNKHEDNMDKGTTETTNIEAPRHTRRSSRRSLNFISDDQVRDGSSSYCPSSNCESVQTENFNANDQPRTMHCTQEMEVMMRKNDMETSHVLAHSMNQVQEDYLSRSEQLSQSPTPYSNTDTLKDCHMLTDQIVCTRGKCQIVFSDVTHDKEANTVQVSMNPNCQWAPKSSSDSICSSTCLTPEKQVRGLKRQHMGTTDEAEHCKRSENGMIYNSLQKYLAMFSQNTDPRLHFPAIYKKRRTEKGHGMVTSNLQITASTSDSRANLRRQTTRDSCTMLFTSPTYQGSSVAPYQGNNLLTFNHITAGTQNGRQVFEDLLALGPTQTIKKRRSKAPTRLRNVASLLEIHKKQPVFPGRASKTSRILQNIQILHEPYTCMEALVADTRSTMATKKRSKRSMLINSTVQNLSNLQNSASSSTGPPLALTWRIISPVDYNIMEHFSQLDLNADNIASEAKYNAFMAYQGYYQDQHACRGYYQDQHALVPFQNCGAVVPFDTSFDQVKRRRPRPKVDLDDETTRVWKLLLENINSEGIDGTDEEKTKWWEEERRVFNGRADSFIARMHLVQGDRRFSPWKGSVVDSVVGVFLTQNVSDHLSSSAYMSLAAQFPLRSKIHPAELHDEGLGNKINESEVSVLESDGTFGLNKEILNQSVYHGDTNMLQDFEENSIREVNSVKSSNGIIPKGNLRGQLTDTCAYCPVSREVVANKSISFIEYGRETEETLSSQTPEISSQNSADSPIAQTTERSDSCLRSTSEEEPTGGSKPNRFTSSIPFVKLLEMAGTVLHEEYIKGSDKRSEENQHVQSESSACSLQNEGHLDNCTFCATTFTSCSQSTLRRVPNSGAQATECDLSQKNDKFSDSSSNRELCSAEISELSSESASGTTFEKMTAVNFEEVQKNSSLNAHSSNIDEIETNQKIVGNQTSQAPSWNKMQEASKIPTYPQNLMGATGSCSNTGNSKNSEHNEIKSNKNVPDNHPGKMVNGPKTKDGRTRKEKENQVDWDELRKQTQTNGRERARTANTLDSVDWDAVRCADVKEIAHTIRERGMNNMLAERIQDFLNRIVTDHGSIDLEWLRDIPPDKAKEYLLSIRGLGLKSVECVRLLTLHHLAFPVDTNVGRIAVRLGWVPLQPLPESLQLHLLELYPVLESIQKYLWPRLCKLDQRTLYELHYQMITFGKVFCTKSKPNCNACPMRGECRHFASAFASARLALPAPQEKSIISANEDRKADQNPIRSMNNLQLPSPQANEMVPKSGVSNSQPIIEEPPSPEPIIEVPGTPEPDYTQVPECDIENALNEDPDEIPTIQLNMEEFAHNLQTIMQQNTELQEGDMSKALVALTSEAASIPVPKLKNMSRLRTEHRVYELPDTHPLLKGMDEREPDDPSPYLLAIWTPGETMDSIEPPERRCSSQEFEKLCTDETCLSCNSIREANSQTVRGTLLIPCRTAMRGSFPLNGTYFQVNEVFADHASSLSPMDVPREWLWNLPRRTVYFGTSIPTIFKGLSTEGIQYCFWRGFVCVRGFDRKTRAPRPLIARLHFPVSRLPKGKGKIDENHT